MDGQRDPRVQQQAGGRGGAASARPQEDGGLAWEKSHKYHLHHTIPTSTQRQARHYPQRHLETRPHTANPLDVEGDGRTLGSLQRYGRSAHVPSLRLGLQDADTLTTPPTTLPRQPHPLSTHTTSLRPLSLKAECVLSGFCPRGHSFWNSGQFLPLPPLGRDTS